MNASVPEQGWNHSQHCVCRLPVNALLVLPYSDHAEGKELNSAWDQRGCSFQHSAVHFQKKVRALKKNADF